MKVLLVSPNQVSFPHRITPIGILYLAGALRRDGHAVRVLDLMFSPDPKKDICRSLKTFRPDIAGLSLRNLDTMISKENHLISYQYQCFQTIKEYSDAISILGGPGYTISPMLLSELFNPDFGIAGEADYSLPELIRRIESNQFFKDIPGLLYKEREVWVQNPFDLPQNLDQLPDQAIDLVNFRKYRRNRGFIGILTKRSCTQSCYFCDERVLYGNKVRLRSPDIIVDEIAGLQEKTRMRYFDFADALFNSPKSHMHAVLKEIIKRKLRIKFKVELNPLGQDEESVSLLKRAGCIGVDLSPDAGSEQMLKIYNKGFSKNRILEVAQLYDRHRLPYSAGFLLGGPGESHSTLLETIQLAESLPGVNLVYFTVGLTLGGNHSKMEKEVSDRTIKKESDLITVQYYLDDGFDDHCAAKLLDACRKNANFYISDIFLSDSLKYFWKVGDFMNLRPVWKYGKLPSRAMKMLKIGQSPLNWNRIKRKFETG